jgi:Kef-type K+ transport system membrane component KefB
MESAELEMDVFTGVPSTYEDLFDVFLFLVVLYVMGDVICQRGLKIVPPLVGYIATGVALGPEGWNWIPMNPTSWVLLGNLGLVLLIVQAGLEMDLKILEKIGVRGFIIAIVGSILPIALGMLLSWAALDQSWSTVIAMGCCFGPTSAGIAINVLGQCKVLESPLGQLIVAAAIVDDILALLILSQLQALTKESGDVTLSDILVPIVSAFTWLFLGGALALFATPKVMDKLYAWTKTPLISRILLVFRLDAKSYQDDKSEEASLSLVALIGLLVCLLQATHLSQASYLLGAFLAGLAFCQQDGLADRFRKHFQLLIEWLMRIFFAATIGFQVPVSLFSEWRVIGKGFLLSLSLVGKVSVGPLLTPIFEYENSEEAPKPQRWKGQHLWDCAVVGFSMAGEAEFAFVLAVFGVTEGLIPPDLYASIVFAILLSSIISPLLLRTVLAISPYKEDGAATELQEADESIGESAGGKPTVREDATMKA